jgi:hypothetical protein
MFSAESLLESQMPLKQVTVRTFGASSDSGEIFPTNLEEAIELCIRIHKEIPLQWQGSAEMNIEPDDPPTVTFTYSRSMTAVEEENHLRAIERMAQVLRDSEIITLKRLLRKYPEVIGESAK